MLYTLSERFITSKENGPAASVSKQSNFAWLYHTTEKKNESWGFKQRGGGLSILMKE